MHATEQTGPIGATLAVLDVDQVAQLLRCSPKTVQDRARDGDLPGLKWGIDWVFPIGALLRRLDEIALAQAALRREPNKPSAQLHDIKQRKSRRSPPALPDLSPAGAAPGRGRQPSIEST